MVTLKRHLFLLVALVIPATSYALSSENVAPNLDHGNSTHGQGRGSVRANEKVVDTLEEERAGEKVVKLFGVDISSPMAPETVTNALKQLAEKSEKETQRGADVLKGTELDHNLLDDSIPVSEVVKKVLSHPEAANELGRPIVGVKRKAHALEEEKQKLMQQVVDLTGEAGASKPNIIDGFIDDRGLDRKVVAKQIEPFQKFAGVLFPHDRVLSMAVGSVYFKHLKSAPKFTGEKTPIMEDAKESVDWVLNKFREWRVNLDRSDVENALQGILSKEDLGLPDDVVRDMAVGKVAYDILMIVMSDTPKKRKH